MRMRDLASLSRSELEEHFIRGSAEPPTGRFTGTHLCSIISPTIDRAYHRLWQRVGFKVLPFGIDFDRSCWIYFSRLRVARFRTHSGPSRWRDTEVVQLHYDVSRLPGALRRHLYDEIVVLGDSLALGIGGLNAPRGRGEHFFFALERSE